jgi:hypothetical protein
MTIDEADVESEAEFENMIIGMQIIDFTEEYPDE